MVWLVGVLLLAWLAWGPVVLLVVAAVLCVPRVRWWVQDRLWFSRRVVATSAGFVVALAAAVVLVPDGWLPIPPAPGALAGPSYVGRPASQPAEPPAALARNPHRGPEVSDLPGPLGLQPEVDTAWYGLQRCGRLWPTSAGALAALCQDRSGPSLRLVDAASMRPVASRALPHEDVDGCPRDLSYLDEADRVVVATTDRRVLAFRTGTKDEPDLGADATWDLRPYVADGDCLVGLAPGWSGLVWWVSRTGLAGTIDPASGAVGVVDLGEDVHRGIATDQSGAYVVTDDALRLLTAGGDGTPTVVWRTEYSGASGSAPVLVDGGAVAITDEVEHRLGVVFLARDTGAGLCRQSVFEEGEGATDGDLAAVGSGVVVANDGDYASPRSTLLGFTSNPGIARVDLVDGGCVVRWTNEAAAPGAGVTVSRPSGLVYAWTKRPSLTGVSAWYLTAVDADSGRSMWSVRTGTGLLAGSDGSTIAIGPGDSAWLGTLAGLVRVRDRQ